MAQLDKLLLERNRSREEAVDPARRRLAEAQSELAEMHTEVLLSQAEAEMLGSELEDSDPVAGLQSDWEQLLSDDTKLRSEAADLAAALTQRRGEISRGEARLARAQESLHAAAQQIESYEDWSQAVHTELSLAATELAADRQAAARERLQLRAQAAELARRSSAVDAAATASAGAKLRTEVPLSWRAEVHPSQREVDFSFGRPDAELRWCRKAPPQQGLRTSSSAPSLR